MPSSFGALWSKVAKHISQPDDSALDIDPIDLDISVQSTPTSRRLNPPSKAKIATVPGSQKRARDVSGVDQGERHIKRARKASNDERRLMPNYGIAKDAIAISFAGQHNSDLDWTPAGSTSRMPQGNTRRGLHPINTLGHHPRVAQKHVGSAASYIDHGASTQRQALPDASRDRGQNAEERSDSVGSSPRHVPSSNSKRRRVDNTSPNLQTLDPPIDFKNTKADRSRLDVTETKTSYGFSASRDKGPGMAARSERAESFSPEQVDGISHVENTHERGQRKPTISDTHQRPSSGSTRFLSVDESEMEAGPARDDQGVSDTTFTASSPRNPSKANPSNNAVFSYPNLDGWRMSNSTEKTSFQVTRPSHKFANNREEPAKPSSERRLAQGLPVKNECSNSTDRKDFKPNKEINDFYVADAMQDSLQANISKTFQRDNQTSSRSSKRSTAKEKMKASSANPWDHTSTRRYSMGSEDELSSHVAVQSRQPALESNQSVGRNRQDEPHSRALQMLDQHASQKTGPFRYPPTQSPPSQRFNGLASSPASEPSPSVTRIPIKRLLGQLCVFEGNDVELVWNRQLDRFYVEIDGERQLIPGVKTAFHITSAAVNFKWTETSASPTIHLKGSASAYGYGQMMIEFVDEMGKTKFLKKLMSAEQLNERRQRVDLERMQKLCDRLHANILESIRLADMRTATTFVNDGWSQSGAGRQRVRRTTDEDHERIKYDSDDLEISDSLPRRNKGSLSEVLSRMEQQGQPVHVRDVGATPYSVGSRKSRRQTQTTLQKKPDTPPPTEEKWTQIHKLTPWSQSVTYPTDGPRRVTVDFEDLERLDDGEMLNDNIVSYALRRIEEGMSREQKQDVHIFNSYFYSALSRQNNRKLFNYDAVKRWTRSTDLFTMPYVVVPINVDFHWFVAIICNLPTLQRRLSSFEDNSVADHDDLAIIHHESGAPARNALGDTAGEHFRAHTSDADEIQKPSARDSSPRSTEVKCDSDELLEASSDVRSRGETSSPRSSRFFAPKKPKKRSVGRKYSPDEAVIITLDSLGTGRSPEVKFLKQYISAEAQDKRSMDVEAGQLLGITAKGIPMQSNFSDCGLYMIGYLEEFAKNPRKFVSKILSRDMDEVDFKDFSPSKKRAELRDSLLQLSQEQVEQRLAYKAAKREKKRLLAQGGPTEQLQTLANEQPQPSSSASSSLLQSQNEPDPEIEVSGLAIPDKSSRPATPETTDANEPIEYLDHIKTDYNEPFVMVPVSRHKGPQSFTNPVITDRSQHGDTEAAEHLSSTGNEVGKNLRKTLGGPLFRRSIDIDVVSDDRHHGRSADEAYIANQLNENPAEMSEGSPSSFKSNGSRISSGRVDPRPREIFSPETDPLIESANERSQVSMAPEIPDSQEKPPPLFGGKLDYKNLDF